ncbi:hypothetical protein [Paramicrobacterium humi]|nr:hypothetical protein [Microbacterium humi]
MTVMFTFVSLILMAILAADSAVIWTSENLSASFERNWAMVSGAAEQWTAAVAPWFAPLLATVLVTILVWLAIPTDISFRPHWDGHNDEAQFDNESGAKGLLEVRIAMGKAALVITAVYTTWSLWALVWLIVPGVTSRNSPAGGIEFATVLALVPIMLLLGLSAGRFARSRSEPLLDLIRMRGQLKRVERRIALLHKRVAFLPTAPVGRSERAVRSYLWLLTLLICVCVDSLLYVLVVWSSSDWSPASLTPTLIWQAPTAAVVIVGIGSVFSAPSAWQLMRTAGAEGLLEAIAGFLAQALVTGLLLCFSALYSGQKYGPITGLLLAAAFVLPVLAWVTPWWRVRRSPTAFGSRWKFVVAGNAYTSLEAQRASFDRQRRALEGVLWDRYRFEKSVGWGRIMRWRRPNPWSDSERERETRARNS